MPFKTLEICNSSKINTQFWSRFSTRWLWGGTGNKPVTSHLVVPRINFLRSAKGYNAKLIQSTLNVCICQSCSTLFRNIHPEFSATVYYRFPTGWKQKSKATHLIKRWFPGFDYICSLFERGKFQCMVGTQQCYKRRAVPLTCSADFSNNLSKKPMLCIASFLERDFFPKASPLCSVLT